jgi:tRNA modification GTPase
VLSDPIVALATPPGRSALAIIRLSGAGVFDVAARVIEDFSATPSRTARLGGFRNAAGELIDRGIYLAYEGPNSYTGEDSVECTSHGGLVVPARLIAAFEEAGARPARPGEFTRRALLNGRMDLLQAEAVGDLIDATVTAQARSALHQLEGGLSQRIADLRERLLELMALMSYDVDFPEEDEGAIPPERIRLALQAALEEVELLLATAPVGERLREGALVVFAGRPNAGKSSLFNALLGSSRALVTEIPGTTRDTIEAWAEVEGWPVRLADTAGLWDAPAALDRLGVEVSRRYLAAADLVLLCVESGHQPEPDEDQILGERPCLLVRTKSDLYLTRWDERHAGIWVSVVTGEGLERLRRAIAERLFASGGTYADVQPMLTRERHRQALSRAREELLGAGPMLGPQGEPVLAAHHVRQAVLALDELIGVVDVEQVLDRVFSHFCVGK